jgi:hypothetical protein
MVAATATLALLSVAGPVRRAWSSLGTLPAEELRAYIEGHVPAGGTVGFEQYRENPLPLCREALEEKVERLIAALSRPEKERKGTPVFGYPAILNEERFLLQKYRHLLRDATDEGFRTLTYGAEDRYENFLFAVRMGRMDAFVLDTSVELTEPLRGRREDLVRKLEEVARDDALVAGRFRVFHLGRDR